MYAIPQSVVTGLDLSSLPPILSPVCFLSLSRLTVSPSSITRVLRDSDGLEALREQVTDSTDAAAAAATGAVTETAEPAATPAADTVGGATGLQEHRVKTVS